MVFRRFCWRAEKRARRKTAAPINRPSGKMVASPPRSSHMNQFINPNWHVILIHYPLGLLTIGVLIELLAIFWRRSTVRNAGKWMILIGTLACIPTVTTGLYAFNDAARRANPGAGQMASWHEVTAGHPWR